MSKRRARGIPGRTLVPGTQSPFILCAWDTCGRYGYDEIKVVVKEPSKELHYIFCSEAHKSFYVHSHRDNGKLSPLIGR